MSLNGFVIKETRKMSEDQEVMEFFKDFGILDIRWEEPVLLYLKGIKGEFERVWVVYEKDANLTQKKALKQLKKNFKKEQVIYLDIVCLSGDYVPVFHSGEITPEVADKIEKLNKIGEMKIGDL